MQYFTPAQESFTREARDTAQQAYEQQLATTQRISRSEVPTREAHMLLLQLGEAWSLARELEELLASAATPAEFLSFLREAAQAQEGIYARLYLQDFLSLGAPQEADALEREAGEAAVRDAAQSSLATAAIYRQAALSAPDEYFKNLYNSTAYDFELSAQKLLVHLKK